MPRVRLPLSVDWPEERVRMTRRRAQVPISAFSRGGLLPASLQLIVSKKSVTFLFRGEVPEIL